MIHCIWTLYEARGDITTTIETERSRWIIRSQSIVLSLKNYKETSTYQRPLDRITDKTKQQYNVVQRHKDCCLRSFQSNKMSSVLLTNFWRINDFLQIFFKTWVRVFIVTKQMFLNLKYRQPISIYARKEIKKSFWDPEYCFKNLCNSIRLVVKGVQKYRIFILKTLPIFRKKM